MKIKSVTIQGMHKVTDHTYELSDCNYLFGKNGSGKSTVLEAIQLAILGYIPDYPKRNQDIVKHANSRMMAVKVVFDDENYIERTYMKGASKVTYEMDTSLSNIEEITSDIEIPIYNFSSFLSLSPNEQKKWFLGYLPDTCDFKNDIDLEKLFTDKTSDLAEYDEDYIKSLVEEIHDSNAQSVSDVHEYIKSVISFVKSQIKSKQAVLSDLMYYEDVQELNLDTVNDDIELSQNNISNLHKKLVAVSKIEQRKSMIEKMQQPTKESVEEEPVVIGINEKIKECDNIISKIDEQIKELEENNSIVAAYQEADKELSKCIRPTEVGDRCPYLPEVQCDTLTMHKKEIAKTYKDAKAKFDEAKEEYDTYLEEYKKITEQKKDLAESAINLESELHKVISSYSAYTDAKEDLDEYIKNLDFEYNEEETEYSIEIEIEKLQEYINELMETKSKLLANEKYKEMSETNQKELYDYENHLVLLETLRDYTGPNELQAELAEKPFVNLSSTITEYLKKMFNDDAVECWFNLSSKSNSFEFGIKRNGLMIPFTVLSSGEKCMYMLAMQSALMTSNQQEFNTILIDDAFDHLDDDNIITLVEAILDTNIQYIIAGVATIPDTKELKSLNRIAIGG